MKMNAKKSREQLQEKIDGLLHLMYEVRFNFSCRDENYRLLGDGYHSVFGVELPDSARTVLTSTWDPCVDYDPLTKFKFMASQVSFDPVGFWATV